MKSSKKTPMSPFEKTMRLAEEFRLWNSCQIRAPKGANLVNWVDTRKTAYMRIERHAYQMLPKMVEALEAVKYNSGHCSSDTMRLVHHALAEAKEVKP